MQNSMKKCFYIVLFVICGSLNSNFFAGNTKFLLDEKKNSSSEHQKLYSPRTLQELQKIVNSAQKNYKKISIIGAGKSQGGQTVSSLDSWQVSLHMLNRLVFLDVFNKQVKIEAGMTWKQLQEYIAPHKLAIKAMQSYHDFSIGGSISVNVHGQDLSTGQIISTIVSLDVLLASGQIVTVSRQENADLFAAIVGGYGLIGIIVSVTLQLTDDVMLDRSISIVNSNDFVDYFNQNIRNNKDIEFYSARFSMGSQDFMQKSLIVTYKKSSQQQPSYFVLDPHKQNKKGILVKLGMQLIGFIGLAKNFRFLLESFVFSFPEKISRNNFLGYSIKGLPQKDNSVDYILQEYFLPYDQVTSFMKQFSILVNTYDINILNVTARHVLKDQESFLSFAPHNDMCALVIYIKLPLTNKSEVAINKWSRAIIDQIIAHNGTYYLPYHLFATQKQFEVVYSNWRMFLKIKENYDPHCLFTNKLYECYAESL